METWVSAGQGERRLYRAIAAIVGDGDGLLEFLFDPKCPKLRRPADELLIASSGLSSGDRLLVKLAIDLWCEQGQMSVSELLTLEEPMFSRALRVFGQLRGHSSTPTV